MQAQIGQIIATWVAEYAGGRQPRSMLPRGALAFDAANTGLISGELHFGSYDIRQATGCCQLGAPAQ